MPCADVSDVPFNTVDIFNARSGIWTTAALSVARYYLAATSLPNDGLAIFAGGLYGAQYVLKSLIIGGCVYGGEFLRLKRFASAADLISDAFCSYLCIPLKC